VTDQGPDMKKNYYLILGIENSASAEEIRNAYREKVKCFHPDHYSGDRNHFLDIQEAYSVLSDPERRTAYDQIGQDTYESKSEGFTRGRTYSGPAEPLIPDQPPQNFNLRNSFENYTPSLEEIFDRLQNNFFQRGFSKSERSRPLHVEIILSRAEAFRGGEVELEIPLQKPCRICDGSGVVGFFDCLYCDGSGIGERNFFLRVPYPSGITRDYTIDIPLTSLGIRNFYLVVNFRLSDD